MVWSTTQVPSEEPAEAGFHVLATDARTCAPVTFGAVRPLIRTLLPVLGPEAPVLSAYRPELGALLPDLADPRPLARIAFGGTKRRLHGDSERLHRIADAATAVLAAGIAILESPVLLRIDGAEHCDRYTLNVLWRLLHRPAAPGILLCCAAADARPRWSPPPLDDPAERRWTDAESLQAQHFRRFITATAAIEVRSGQPAPAGPPPRDPGRATAAGAEFLRARHELVVGASEKAAQRALRLAQASFGFMLDHELILLCCRIAFASRSVPARLPALQFTGLVHAYLGHSDLAVEIFTAAHHEAPSPQTRAQLCYYLGLLESKRRARPSEGKAWFTRGFAELTGRDDPQSRLERGWLCNGSALAAWLENRPADASRFLDAALAEVGDTSALEANLRVNLLNNRSVLEEQRGDYAAALRTWRDLEALVPPSHRPVFAKAHRYREALLLSACGLHTDAYQRMASAGELAREQGDQYHLRAIASACVYLACLDGRYDDASTWAEELIVLAATDDQAQAHAFAQAAHVHIQAGAVTQARSVLERGLTAVPSAAMLIQARNELDSHAVPARPGPGDGWAGIRLDQPRTKLTAPFPWLPQG